MWRWEGWVVRKFTEIQGWLYEVTSMGAFDGGPQCCMSILRNDNVPCHYLCNYPVDFEIT